MVADLVVFGGVFVRTRALEVIHWYNQAVLVFCVLFIGQPKVKLTCFGLWLTYLGALGGSRGFERANQAVGFKFELF